MKKLLVVSIVAAFAFVGAAQAGESASKAKGACPASSCCAKDAKAKVTKKAPEKGATLLVMR